MTSKIQAATWDYLVDTQNKMGKAWDGVSRWHIKAIQPL